MSDYPKRVERVTVQPEHVGGMEGYLLRRPLDIEAPMKGTILWVNSMGLKVWRLCDGKTGLRKIAETVERERGIPWPEALNRTLRFLLRLMEYGMIRWKSPFADNMIFKRNEAIVSLRQTQYSWIVFHTGTCRSIAVNSLDKRILELCDGKNTFSEILSKLSNEYRGSSAAMRNYLESFIKKSLKEDLVSLTDLKRKGST